MGIDSYRISGGSKPEERAENDFYATNPKAVEMLFEQEEFTGNTFLEPCVGQGHIANVIKNRFPKATVVGMDLIDRGYEDTIVENFLDSVPDIKVDNIITNPPYSCAQEFIEKGFEYLKPNGKMAMFLKLHFLESAKRKVLFDEYPPKYIYVFRNRMSTWRDGSEKDEKGKKWTTTLCHAWFIWENGFKGEPIMRWL